MLRFVALFAVVLVGCATALPSTCTPEYQQYKTDKHTYCLEDDPKAVAVPLTQEVKDAIVNRHNEIRSTVDPPAANMEKMVWDERLARVAEKWAMQCVRGHDHNRSLPEMPGFIGQNAARGQSTFVEAINDWYSEVKDWVKDKYLRGTGHYFQEIFHGAARIGCGLANCNDWPKNYYPNGFLNFKCNYYRGPGGPHYDAGQSCAACPNHCDGKLCDCKGKVCFNGGTLDLSTCQCKCDRLWTGEDCRTLNCPKKDFEYPCRFPDYASPEVCAKPENSWRIRDCPIACGFCEAPCNGLKCQNQGQVDPDTCTCQCPDRYSGKHCEICPEADVKTSWCTTMRDDNKCHYYSNMRSLCPYICGYC